MTSAHVFHQSEDWPELEHPKGHRAAYVSDWSPPSQTQATQDLDKEQQIRQAEHSQHSSDAQRLQCTEIPQASSRLALMSLRETVKDAKAGKGPSKARHEDPRKAALLEKKQKERDARSAKQEADEHTKQHMRTELAEKNAKKAADKKHRDQGFARLRSWTLKTAFRMIGRASGGDSAFALTPRWSCVDESVSPVSSEGISSEAGLMYVWLQK